VEQNNTERLVRQILQRAEDIYNMLSPGIPAEWFTSDLTVAQLRVLLVLQSTGSSRMSDIASVLDVALSTATGIVDKLVKKEMVSREADPQDRRLVICRLSPAGQEIMNRLWTSGQFQMESLLDGLNEEELEKASEVAEILFNNLINKNQK
jgi:DNA-binding MarR family transcriptional regulator